MAMPFLEIAIIVRRKGSSGKTWVSGEFLLRQQFSTKLVLTPSDPIGFDTMWIVGMKMMVNHADKFWLDTFCQDWCI